MVGGVDDDDLLFVCYCRISNESPHCHIGSLDYDPPKKPAMEGVHHAAK